MPSLRSFDAFPKVERTYEKTNANNSVMSYVMMAMGVFMLYLETTSWMGAHGDFEFSVDTKIRDQFQINLGITVLSKCKMLDVFIQDIAEDRLLVSELVEMIPIVDEITGQEKCHIAGTFNANRVSGTLVITHRGAGYFPPPSDMNYSHRISKLSFGEFHPGLMNPLDFKVKNAKSARDYFTYMLTILPTTVHSLGMGLETTQYTVAEFTNDKQHMNRHPGIFIEYDFDPINVGINDTRMSFIQWLARVANIYGGILVLARAYMKVKKNKQKMEYREELL